MKIVAICGSLRQESYNLKLLQNFAAMLPKTTQYSIEFFHDFPLFNEDVEAKGIPKPVDELAQKIALADAIVFGCPEYNYSIPGVLKNGIDWLSRHPKKPFAKKTVAIMGASPGRLGSARAQYHLRQVGVFLDLRILNRPEIMLSEAHRKFDEQGNLNDAGAKDLLLQLIQVLHA